jgi:hypothetical protein
VLTVLLLYSLSNKYIHRYFFKFQFHAESTSIHLEPREEGLTSPILDKRAAIPYLALSGCLLSNL